MLQSGDRRLLIAELRKAVRLAIIYSHGWAIIPRKSEQSCEVSEMTKVVLCSAVLLVLMLLFSAVPGVAATCESLASMKLPNATITTAQAVGAGAFAPAGGGGRGGAAQFSDLPAFCRIAVTSKPTADSDIKIEVWMPAIASWNGKFEAVGNG